MFVLTCICLLVGGTMAGGPSTSPGFVPMFGRKRGGSMVHRRDVKFVINSNPRTLGVHEKQFSWHMKTIRDDLSGEERGPDVNPHHMDYHRRSLLLAPLLIVMSPCEPANAQLVQFPPKKDFLNTYHLMRAGESIHQSQHIIDTNGLFLTNREEHSLTRRGTEQVRDAVQILKRDDMAPTIVNHSIAASSTDSAVIVAAELDLGKSRVVPEFEYLDPRGVGLWDGLELEKVEEALWALDYDEAGINGSGPKSKPPGNDDGTPNEMLIEQVVRLRQLISILETRYSGDTILLIFPDGSGPAVLMAMIGGLPLNRVHELELQPGEIRTDVTNKMAKTLLPPSPPEDVLEKIERGRQHLTALNKDPKSLVRVTDRWLQDDMEEERLRQEETAKRRRRDEEEARALANARVRQRKEEERKRREEVRAQKEEDERKKKEMKLRENEGRILRNTENVARAKEKERIQNEMRFKSKQERTQKNEEYLLAQAQKKQIKNEERSMGAAKRTKEENNEVNNFDLSEIMSDPFNLAASFGGLSLSGVLAWALRQEETEVKETISYRVESVSNLHKTEVQENISDRVESASNLHDDDSKTIAAQNSRKIDSGAADFLLHNRNNTKMGHSNGVTESDQYIDSKVNTSNRTSSKAFATEAKDLNKINLEHTPAHILSSMDAKEYNNSTAQSILAPSALDALGSGTDLLEHKHDVKVKINDLNFTRDVDKHVEIKTNNTSNRTSAEVFHTEPEDFDVVIRDNTGAQKILVPSTLDALGNRADLLEHKHDVKVKIDDLSAMTEGVNPVKEESGDASLPAALEKSHILTDMSSQHEMHQSKHISPDERAAIAMEEYVSQDDGFSDFSGLLLDILNDD